MSLLNEMLHDLSKQKNPYVSVPVYPAALTERPLKPRQWLIGVGLVFAVAFFVWMGFFLRPSSQAEALVPEPQAQALANSLISLPLKVDTLSQPSELVSYVVPLSAYASQWVPLNNVQQPIDWVVAASRQARSAVSLVNKVYSPQTAEEWHETQFNKALKAIRRGDDEQAIGVLQTILVKMPEAMDARENLASLYLTYGDLSSAKDVVEEGLDYAPESPALNTIKARLLLVQDKAIEAVRLLSYYHPSMSEYPDYYGTLAAALHSSGRILEAGSLYKSLLQVEPDNGQYWLGYGIFLESHHKTHEAIDAYTRASQNPESESVVREYAEKRLKTLQG